MILYKITLCSVLYICLKVRESPLYDDGFAKNVCKICNLEQEGAFSALYYNV